MDLILWLVLAAGQDRAPVPDPAAAKEAEKLIREVFKEDYGKKGSAERITLAHKLVKQGIETKDDPTSRYALFAQAEDLAIQGADVECALQAIEEMARGFLISESARKDAALHRISALARTAEEFQHLTAAWLRLADVEIREGELDRAEKAGTAAGAQARKGKDMASVTRAEALGKEIADLKGKFPGLPQARATLLTKTDDSAANSLVGRFECLVLGEWERGLPRLALGAEGSFKELAQNDLNPALDVAGQSALADAWYSLAEKESGRVRISLLRHAGERYRALEGVLSGLSKTKVEKRVGEILRMTGAGREVDLLRLLDLKKDASEGKWTMEGNVLVCLSNASTLNIPYAPPEEYELRMIVERKLGKDNLSFGVVVDGHQASVTMDEQGTFAGLSRIDGVRANQNETSYSGALLARDQERALWCEVRKGRVTFTVDGKRIFDWKGDPKRLSRNPALPITRPDTLYLICNDHFLIKKMILTPLVGEGKNLR